MRFFLLLTLAFSLLACDNTFRDTRELPEPPELPAQIRPCPPEASILADKMNVLYLGVDNPISIDLRHANEADLRVTATGADIRGSRGKFILKPLAIGEVRMEAFIKDELVAARSFRAKRISDPVVKLGNSAGGRMGSGEFKAQRGLSAFLNNFDFDAKCMVAGYMITRIEKDGERQSNINHGTRFGTSGSALILQASPGDIYTFTEVRVRCPGDQANRLLNSLAFHIK